ncbi:MAG: type II toxin-antitoxin system RelE/ParE family toxin [Pseudomonadota bacterium]
MPSYNIEWKSSAKKELRRLPKQVIHQIINFVGELPGNPYPAGSRKIIGTEHTYRQRIGDYRIVYSIKSGCLVIEIVRVGHRKSVYKNIR